MATYKVTIPVTLIVEITGDAHTPDPISAAQSGSAAARRASNYLLSGPMGLRKQLGICRLFINERWENVTVEPTTPAAKGLALPAAPDSLEELAGDKPLRKGV